MAWAHSATSHVRLHFDGLNVTLTTRKLRSKNTRKTNLRLRSVSQKNSQIVILRQAQDSNCQIVNANTELIPQTPNREPIPLIVVATASIPREVAQGTVPSIVCTGLRRTPPATEAANEVVISTAVAVTARKRRK